MGTKKIYIMRLRCVLICCTPLPPWTNLHVISKTPPLPVVCVLSTCPQKYVSDSAEKASLFMSHYGNLYYTCSSMYYVIKFRIMAYNHQSKESEKQFYKNNSCHVKWIFTEEKKGVVIRTCIGQDLNSQCGTFNFRNRSIRGCMLTCDTDLCNSAATFGGPPAILMALLLIIGFQYWTKTITRHVTG